MHKHDTLLNLIFSHELVDRCFCQKLFFTLNMKERYSLEEMEKGKNLVFHGISSGFMKEEHTKKTNSKGKK